VQAAQAYDRIGAVIPTLHAGAEALSAAEVASGAGLPEVLEVPASDSGCILLRAAVRKMIGALDPSFAGSQEALTDWSLRAQRLGFVTVRALRAWARVTSGAASLSHDPALSRRHASFDAQRRQAEADVAARLPQQALALARGPISVCLDVRYLPEDAINGTGLYAMELGRALAAHTPARVSWLVFTDGQQRALERVGATVYKEGAAIPPFDLVHRPAQVFRARDLPWLLSAQAPLVITYQDLIAYRAYSAFARFEDHEDYRAVSHLALRSAQAVIAISGHNRSEILRHFFLEDDDHVRVVHHGVDAARFAVRDPDRNRRLLAGLGVEGPFFFSVGSDYAHKNLRLLLASHSAFRGRWAGPNRAPSLVIAGHPSGTVDGIFPSLRQQSPAGVIYLGDVSDEALTALYQESVALLYLSAYEGFGLPLLEAMAARTPALCSRLSSIPEVAGDAALYADDLTDLGVARQMTELATQEALRHQLADRGSARVRSFTWAETARQTFAVYQRALRSPPARSLHERRTSAALAGRLFS
jgi:glycosyltransferase involved in cell wall biosynthesis